MAYTEVKERNNRKYFYRVISLREGNKIKKQRIYLGVNLSVLSLLKKEIAADKKISNKKSIKSIEKIKSDILPILRKRNVKRAGIFGSYAKGLQKKNSDVDILIEPPKNMGFAFAGLKDQLSKALKKKVDLVSYNGLSVYLRDKILKEEVRIIWTKRTISYS